LLLVIALLVAGVIPIVLALQSTAAAAGYANSAEQPPAASALLFSWEQVLWIVNSDGSGLKQLYHFKPDQAYDVQADPSLSPDALRIAYVNYRRLDGSPLLHPNVWVMNADGSGVTPLTAEPMRHFGPLAWSPDGRKLAAVSTLTDFDEHKQIKYLANGIFMVNADGSGAKLLIQFTDPEISIQSVAWSPDSRKIAFLESRSLYDGQKLTGLNENIWVMDADGSHLIPLTKFTRSIWLREIGWSPDSRRVTYISSRALDGSDAGSAGTNIWVSNADGSGSLPLTRFRSMFVTINAFSWSPDGSRLSFSSNGSLDGSDTDNTSVNIWVVKTDGSAPRPLTTETVFELSNDRPAWSPDGSRIAFVSCINSTSTKPRPFSSCKLSIMKEDGTGVRQLIEQNVGWFQWRK
jgi:TolB protein